MLLTREAWPAGCTVLLLVISMQATGPSAGWQSEAGVASSCQPALWGGSRSGVLGAADVHDCEQMNAEVSPKSGRRERRGVARCVKDAAKRRHFCHAPLLPRMNVSPYLFFLCPFTYSWQRDGKA